MLFVSFGAYNSSGVNALGADGTQVSEWSGLHYPAGLAVSSDGATLLLDDRNSTSAVRELSPDTITVLDGLRQKPQGVAIDSTGTMYVTFRAEGYSRGGAGVREAYAPLANE